MVFFSLPADTEICASEASRSILPRQFRGMASTIKTFCIRLPLGGAGTDYLRAFTLNLIQVGLTIRFTHTIDMDWLLSGVRPTGRKAEFIVAVLIKFDGGEIAHEHIYWDQATVLSQLGADAVDVPRLWSEMISSAEEPMVRRLSAGGASHERTRL
jgi:hypothetical protein